MTTFQTPTWEHRLLSLAHEAYQSITPPVSQTTVDQRLLERAYRHCESLTASYSRSFYLATSLLPVHKRRAIRALYAFCRVTDEIVDRPRGNPKKLLTDWREAVLSAQPMTHNQVAMAWADTQRRYHIPQRYAEQLIKGVECDLAQKRYATFEGLTAYAYGVASTVGLMSMHIIGFSGSEAIPYAIKLGVALQLTNILRDVGEDWHLGRVYLPAEEMAAFGVTEAHLAAGQVDDRWRALMRFQIERNRRLYAEAWPGIRMLDRDGRFAVAAAGEFYRAILTDIETHDFDVFNRRAQVSTLDKLSKLPRLWWGSR